MFPISIPPLRERGEDVLTLARHFVDRFCRDLNKKALALSPAALVEMRAYPWPGNVRELQNCIERAVILCDSETIHPRHLSLSFRDAAPVPSAATSPWDQIDLSGTLADALRRVLNEVERRKVERAIRDAAGNKPRAADLLQISPKMLQQKMKDYGITDA